MQYSKKGQISLSLRKSKHDEMNLINRRLTIARNSEPLPLAKRDETLPCAMFLFIGKCMEMIV